MATVDDDLAWDDDHPTLQQIPKPTGWDTLIEERPVDDDLIATIQAQRIDVRYELAQTKQRLRLMSLVAVAALAICAALGFALWSHPSPASRTAEAAEPDVPGDTQPAVAAPAEPEDAPPERAEEPAPAPVAAEPAEAEESAPDFGISASGTGVTMFVDGVKKGALPLTVSDVPPGVHDVRFEGPGGRKRVVQIELGSEEHRDLGNIAFDETKVQVVITLSTPRTAVLLKPEHGKQQPLTGPWPMSVELEPGSYSLVAARRGAQIYARPLVLDLQRPYREINIRLR